MTRTQPIGVMDSGVGGLTLVRELRRILPGEDILYLGDSANCPYGNRTHQEIAALSQNMIDFLRKNRVKAVAVACNTISALVEELAQDHHFRLIGIVSPVARSLAQSGVREVGVFATEFTISTGIYSRTIGALDPSITVRGKGSPHLAALVDRGEPDARLELEIRRELGRLLEEQPLQHVILGCTHYPIVEQSFRSCFPHLVYINPAVEQARAMADYLVEHDLANPGQQGSLRVLTSGDTRQYRRVIRRLELAPPATLQQVAL